MAGSFQSLAGERSEKVVEMRGGIQLGIADFLKEMLALPSCRTCSVHKKDTPDR